MKSIAMLASAALVITAVMVSTAQAQQDTSSTGGMMNNGFIGMMGASRPGMMGYAGGFGMMGSNAPGSAMCSAMVGHIDGRLAYVKAELKVTDTQERLWNSYAAAARDSANTMLARCASMMSGHSEATMSLPERLDQNEQLMAAQLDAVRAMNKALKPLYAALTGTQREAADQLFWGPMGMM